MAQTSSLMYLSYSEFPSLSRVGKGDEVECSLRCEVEGTDQEGVTLRLIAIDSEQVKKESLTNTLLKRMDERLANLDKKAGMQGITSP